MALISVVISHDLNSRRSVAYQVLSPFSKQFLCVFCGPFLLFLKEGTRFHLHKTSKKNCQVQSYVFFETNAKKRKVSSRIEKLENYAQYYNEYNSLIFFYFYFLPKNIEKNSISEVFGKLQ
jgi:hypothetical protein